MERGAGKEICAQVVRPEPVLEVALRHFAHLVENYYNQEASRDEREPVGGGGGKDENSVLQAALEAFEACKGTRGGTVSLCDVDGRVCEVMERIGFLRTDDPGGGQGTMTTVTMRLAHWNHLEDYEATKNRLRSEYHIRRAQQHEARFMAQVVALFDVQRTARSPDCPSETLFLLDRDEQGFRSVLSERPFSRARVKASLSAFVHKYHKVIGVHPFIKGLWALLVRQATEPFVLRWSLSMSFFTEAGGLGFLTDALDVLDSLLFVPLKLVHQDDGVDVVWQVWEGLTNKDISTLVHYAMPSYTMRKLVGSPTGTTAVCDIRRTSLLTGDQNDGHHQRHAKETIKVLFRKVKLSLVIEPKAKDRPSRNVT